ncbi:addiction module protein [Pedosphaera parvula]|uniref:Addiction module component, TIGR02574 family n=1 Tax=Pedosphaera parvula (strain Ellin514) TaxID=320771 RepID=B9XEP0_PEDPL|nr:addiction module protein [Pedosphaera parvula]EEF61754.1 conserved hypothetical protein [Pedosphaera parvula Ellin514]
MDINLPLDQMTREEKLRLMEAIRADLSRHDEQVESPGWHEGELCERDDKLKSVGELPVDWETAKTHLRDRLV